MELLCSRVRGARILVRLHERSSAYVVRQRVPGIHQMAWPSEKLGTLQNVPSNRGYFFHSRKINECLALMAYRMHHYQHEVCCYIRTSYILLQVKRLGDTTSALMDRHEICNLVVCWCTNELVGCLHIEKCFMQRLIPVCRRFNWCLFQETKMFT